MSEPAQGHYVDAGEVHTYYEVEGDGDPLILLHGGFATIGTWANQRPALAERYQVFLPERRGHGRTADVPGPTGFDVMARDTLAFMDALEIPSAHIVGWSDGAMVGMELAMNAADRVGRFVFIGAPIHIDGYTDETKAMNEDLSPDSLPPFIRDAYAALSPDGPDHFQVVFDKLATVWKTEPRHDLADLARVTAPTLILLGDHDMVTLAHADAVRQALPDGQLAVVPGTDHGLVFEKPDLVNRLILDFLAET